MGIDIPTTTDFHGTLNSWVKCARCSERLGKPYPVETMAFEPVAEESGRLGRKYTMIIPVECHGESMRCAIEVPVYWTNNMRMHALAYVYAFVRKGPLYTCEVRRGTKGQSPGMLSTEVR
jgi:hypothetical protein